MGTKHHWIRVSRASPCPICKEPDWCSISGDGVVAKCMRIEEGCFKIKEDRSGGRYFLHRLADGPHRNTDWSTSAAGAGPQRADADTLNEVYAAFLSQLALNKSHRENLLRRGLSDETIERNGYKTLPLQGRARIATQLRERFGDQVLRVPGFVVKEGDRGRYLTVRGPAGIVVPVRNLAGHIVALKVRRDGPGDGGSRYVYVSSTGHGGPGPASPAHVPLGMAAPAEVVRLTEGELKADISQSLSGLPTLSVPGAATWKPCLPVLKQLGTRIVRLAFDVDAWEKPQVARALAACAEAVAAEGHAVELERWAATDGKGIDDVLAAGKAPEVLQGEAATSAISEILSAATSGEESTQPDELTRLLEVLQTGGAEALFRDKLILKALTQIEADDPAQYAAIRASIGGRVRLRDLDKALAPFRREQARERPPAVEATGVYRVVGGCIVRERLTQDGAVEVPMCNFAALIVEVVTHDDGAERTTVFGIEGSRADGRPLQRAEVPAQEFPRLEWVTPAWQGQAVVYAGQGTSDHLRAALELLSCDRTYRTEFLHTGWRRIGERWYYLHAGGAIGPNGLAADVAVSLPEALAGFKLPTPPTAKELAAAVRASLGLLDGLAPDRIVFPLLAAVYRAVLGDCDFSPHLAGPTGVFKSELAALAQQHFGAGLDARHLPGSWSSTGNALEGVAFAAKDALLTVDDFAPTGSVHDLQRFHREADRILRAQGNRAGRLRMRADASLRAAKPPRGLILSTGEDTPRGQSLRSRLLTTEVSPGDVNVERLTACQKNAAAGLFAQSLAGFLHWLAPQYADVRGRLRQEQADLRDNAKTEGQHARTPGIVADVALGLRYFLDFAEEAGASTPAGAAALWERGWKALTQAAAEQVVHIAAAEPTSQFLRLLLAALGSGRAHVAAPDGNPPQDAEGWGWRRKPVGALDHASDEWQLQGKRIGWVDEDNLYLGPDAAFAEVQRLAGEQGESLPISPRTLNKRLHERGLLAAVETHAGKTRFTIRRTLEGQCREVICLRADSLSPPASAPSAPTGKECHGNRDPVRHTGVNGVRQPDSECAIGALAEARVRHENRREDDLPSELAHWAHSNAVGESQPGNDALEQADGWGEWQ
jgi:hypothetical protein